MADNGKKDMVKEYEKMQSKHSLPSYRELDKEYALGSMEPTDFVLRAVLNKMADRCDYARKLLGDLIQPENHIADMQEAEALSDPQKEKILELFKRLSYHAKEFIVQDFDHDEQRCADTIKEFHSEWLSLKPGLLEILRSLKKTWSGKVEIKSEYGYFG